MSATEIGTPYERTRDAILMALFRDFGDESFSRDDFEATMEDATGYGDDRTTRKYWAKLAKRKYIKQINAKSALLSPEIVRNGGRVHPLVKSETESPDAEGLMAQ